MKLDRVERVEFLSLREYFKNKLSNYTQTKQMEFQFYDQEQTNLSRMQKKKVLIEFVYRDLLGKFKNIEICQECGMKIPRILYRRTKNA